MKNKIKLLLIGVICLATAGCGEFFGTIMGSDPKNEIEVSGDNNTVITGNENTTTQNEKVDNLSTNE